jgi:hypothetical protein
VSPREDLTLDLWIEIIQEAQRIRPAREAIPESTYVGTLGVDALLTGSAVSGDSFSYPAISERCQRRPFVRPCRFCHPDLGVKDLVPPSPASRRQKSLGIVGGGGNHTRREMAERTAISYFRRLHYLSTNWEVFGGVARTIADWIGGGKRRHDNDL